MTKITTFRCYVSQEKREAFMSLASPVTAGIWLKLCDRASNASSWKLTGTISDLAALVPCSESDFQTFLDECREHELVEIWTNGDRISLVSGALTAAMERRERQRAQARARMKRYRGKGQGKKAAHAPGSTEEDVTRNARNVTQNILEEHVERASDQAPEPVCAVQNRFTVHEDDNVVVVVVVSYKNKQQLQPPATVGDSPVEAASFNPSANPPSNGTPAVACPVQMPFVPFPGVTLPPMQLVMSGIVPEMPKPQVVVDNTHPSREKDLDQLKQILPEKLQVPNILTVIGSFYDERGFGYIKAQIDYVLRRKYRGVDGFCGYLEKAVLENFAQYSEPARPSSPAVAGNAFEKRTAAPCYESEIDRSARFMAIPILEQMEMQKEIGNSIAAQQWQELKRAAIQQYPYCEREDFLLWAMTQVIIDDQGFRDKALISTIHRMGQCG